VVGAIYVVDTIIFAAIPIIQRRRERLDGSISLQDMSAKQYETYHISTKRSGSLTESATEPPQLPPLPTPMYGATVAVDVTRSTGDDVGPPVRPPAGPPVRSPAGPPVLPPPMSGVSNGYRSVT